MTPEPRIAIVAALEREVRPLTRTWRLNEKEHEGRSFRFFEKGELVLVCGGIGPEAARRAASAAIALFAPTIIYSAGFAGTLNSELRVGDLFRPARVIDVNDGSSVTASGGEGVLVSFASVANPEQKAKLGQSFAAQAVDMEAASVARAAESRGVEFRAIKVISDPHDFIFPSVEKFVDANGNFSESRFALFAAVRPWLWLQVFRLMRNSNRASTALCASLESIDASALVRAPHAERHAL